MDTRQNNRPPAGPAGQPVMQRPPRPAQPGQSRQAPPRKAPPKRRRTGAEGKGRTTRSSGASRRELEAKLARQNSTVAGGSRRVRRPSRPTQPVVYTQPKVFNRNRMLLKLLLVVSVVLAMTLALSIFFKVKTIKVAGANAYTEWEIREASGIQEGDNLLTFSKARAVGQIQAKLPYVNEVRIGIKLPDTVIIYVEELEVVYAAQCSNGLWWLITSEGRVVEQVSEGEASNYTKVLGIRLHSPAVNEQAVAEEVIPESSDSTDATDESGNALTPPPVTVTGAQKLSTALMILKSLELNGVVGEAASVDVSNLNSITLWYGIRFQVNLGTIDNMDFKIACMKTAIEQQFSEYDMGILDISFTQWKEEIGYTPFPD